MIKYENYATFMLPNPFLSLFSPSFFFFYPPFYSLSPCSYFFNLLHRKGRGPSPPTNMQAASDLRQMLRSSATNKTAPPPPSHGNNDGGNDEEVGPFNFRQMLRKTSYAPTDTIRKRQLKRDGHRGYGSEYHM